MTGTVPAVAAGAMIFSGPAVHAQVVTPPASPAAVVPDAFRKPVVIPQAAVTLTTITVHTGNSLTGLAGHWCHNPADWSGIAAANRSQVKNPNEIYPDEKLVLDCRTDSTVHLPVVREVVRVNADHPAPQDHRHYSASVSGTYHGSGGMQQCIISRESGGNAGIWNASGHWGLYQFSASTWSAHGGIAADFGHASVSEQNQIYYNTVAADGYSDWAPYDGCL